MTPAERRAWIIADLRSRRRGKWVDVLDAEYVNRYLSATGASFRPTNFGAHKCRTLGRDLSRLYRDGLLTRWATGLQNMEPGFPRWVYAYELHPSAATPQGAQER